MNTYHIPDINATGFFWLIFKGLKDMNWTTPIVSFIINGLLVGFFLHWYKNKLSEKIEEYKNSLAKELEQYKFENNKREQSAIVAECLAAWSARKTFTSIEQVENLQRLTWEATLKLPDELALRLNKMMAWESKESPKDILIDSKSFIWGKKTTLEASQIVHYTVPSNITENTKNS